MRRYVAVGVLVVGATLWAYQSVHSAWWVYEDRATRTFAAQATTWERAVTKWTWRVAPTPARGHAVNLALHFALGGVLGVVAWRLGLTPFGAWIVALIWLLHPMATETVAYTKARSEQIVMLGTLLAMLAATGRWWRPLGLAGIVGGIALAIGGEPSGVVAFLLVPLTIWHSRTRAGRAAPWWAPWWAPGIVAGCCLGGGILWYGGLRSVINADTEAGIVSVTAVTWYQWLLTQSGAVWYWVIATGYPVLLTPDADIDRLSGLPQALGMATMVAMGGLAWWVRRTHPLATMAMLLWLCALTPRLIVQTPRSYLNAAQFALPFMGLALLAGYGVEQWRARWKVWA